MSIITRTPDARTVAENPLAHIERDSRPATVTPRIDTTALAGDLPFTVDELKQLPIVTRRTARVDATVRIWQATDGRWWRQGGVVRIQKTDPAGDARALVITLYHGADWADYDFLLDLAGDVNLGRINSTIWKPVQAGWTDERTLTTGGTSRPVSDPHVTIDAGGLMVECDDALCTDTWHESSNAVHHLDEIERELPDRRGYYNITITRNLDEPAWIVNVSTDEFYGTPEDVASLVNDLQWMSASCERANGRTTA